MAVRGQEMDESHIDSYAAHDVAPSLPDNPSPSSSNLWVERRIDFCLLVIDLAHANVVILAWLQNPVNRTINK